MISSQPEDTERMYLLVDHLYRAVRILGPFPYSYMRDMAAVSIHTSEQNLSVESILQRLDIKKNGKPVIECFPHNFFENLYTRKALFSIEDGPGFVGYTDGATWNGWAMPYFTREVAEEVLKAYPGDEGDDEDCYADYAFPEADSVIIIDPDTNQPVWVWPIGSGGWCWDEIPLEKNT